MVDVIKAQLDRAQEDSRVKAVILKVDSPGGEVLASDEIYKAIRISSGHAARAGQAGDLLDGQPRGVRRLLHFRRRAAGLWPIELTLTGSIGVIMHGLNYRGLMDKVGLAPMTYKSGKYKDMLSGERETNEIPAGRTRDGAGFD